MPAIRRSNSVSTAVVIGGVILSSVSSFGAALPAAAAGANANTNAKMDMSKVTLSINTKGFAKKVEREVLKPEPSMPIDEIIMLNGQPPTLRLRFDGEKVDSNNDFNQKHLLVYPLQGYAALYKDAERKRVWAERMALITKIVKSGSARGVQEIPILPESDAGQVFHNQERFLKFKQGSGVSFISSYSNGDPPLTNDGQFYCFQGMTNDGRFYVSFFTPIKSVGIPEGAPITKGVSYLGKLARNKFTPDLDSLDKMMQSIEIK